MKTIKNMKQRKIDIEKVIREMEKKRSFDHESGHDYNAGYFTGMCAAIQIIKDNIKEEKKIEKIKDDILDLNDAMFDTIIYHKINEIIEKINENN